MGAFLFALEVEDHKTGMVYESLPLHCTLIQWFQTAETQERVITIGKEALHATRPVKIALGHLDFFGSKCDVPVHTLEWNFDLFFLHSKLYRTLNTIGVEYVEPHWVGAGYRPHVTRKNGAFPEMSPCTCTAVSVVEALNPGNLTKKRVVARIKLS